MTAAMTSRLERLYLTAIGSGWWLDWQRYYHAEDAERQARLAALARGPESTESTEGEG
jgi:hypothetical protein